MHKLFSKYFRKPEGLIGYYISHKMKKMNEVVYHKLDEKSNIISDMNIFEIGFGPGYGLNYFLKKYKINYHGIDFSKQMYNRTQKIKSKNFPENKGQLFYGDFLEFNKEDMNIDIVLFANVTYFWDDLIIPFKKIFSLLKDGGNLIFYMSGKSRLENKTHTSTKHFNHHDENTVYQTLVNCGYKNVNMTLFDDSTDDRYIFSAMK